LNGLASQEIISIVGSIEDSTEYLKVIERENIDVVVDLAGRNYGTTAKLLKEIREIGQRRFEALKAGGYRANPPKLGYIYTSGIGLHGDSYEQVNDLVPVRLAVLSESTPSLFNWRPALEREILNSNHILDVTIVRPCMVYGGANHVFGHFFGPIVDAVASNAKEIEFTSNVSQIMPLIHCDDVSSAIRLTVEKLSLISGTSVHPVFDLVTSHESVTALMTHAGRVLGFNGIIKYKPTDESNQRAKAFSINVNTSSDRARQILGWTPVRTTGMIAEMENYTRAWKAGAPEWLG
jgi:nucleoside-diphosphate-sugar epimerase